MGLEEKNVYNRELVHKSLSFEFLPHTGSDGGDGHGHVVHGLDFGGLYLVDQQVIGRKSTSQASSKAT